jgi:hypothetical protein
MAADLAMPSEVPDLALFAYFLTLIRQRCHWTGKMQKHR